MNELFKEKQIVMERWLDQNIKRWKALAASEYCPIENISMCGTRWDKTLHIYENLDKLAFYLQKTVVYDPNYMECRGIKYFYYKGCKVFELFNKHSDNNEEDAE